eukprot:gene414-448_t
MPTSLNIFRFLRFHLILTRVAFGKHTAAAFSLLSLSSHLATTSHPVDPQEPRATSNCIIFEIFMDSLLKANKSTLLAGGLMTGSDPGDLVLAL